MRAIVAYVFKPNQQPTKKSILDLLLFPLYFKKAYPKVSLSLYTTKQSIIQLKSLRNKIISLYDNVYDMLTQNNSIIFSQPKFEAMQIELNTSGSNFIMLDLDLYIQPGFLDQIPTYAVYYPEPMFSAWYHQVINGEYDKLNAPGWFTWKSTPVNCATIRINNPKLLQEYIDLFYSITAENLSEKEGHKAMIKEQWSLGEFIKHYKLPVQRLFNTKTSFHRGDVKTQLGETRMVRLQEYLLYINNPELFNDYLNYFKETRSTFPTFPKECFEILDTLDPYYRLTLAKNDPRAFQLISSTPMRLRDKFL